MDLKDFCLQASHGYVEACFDLLNEVVPLDDIIRASSSQREMQDNIAEYIRTAYIPTLSVDPE